MSSSPVRDEEQLKLQGLVRIQDLKNVEEVRKVSFERRLPLTLGYKGDIP